MGMLRGPGVLLGIEPGLVVCKASVSVPHPILPTIPKLTPGPPLLARILSPL